MKVNSLDKKRQLMLEGNLFKTLLLISLPAAMTSLITEIFNLFDIYFSNRIGKTQMAASIFVGPIVNVVTAIGIGLGVAAITLIAKEIANKNYEKSKKILGQFFIIGIVLSIILVVICIFFSKQILSLVGAKGELLENSMIYFKIVILTLPLNFINQIYYGQQRAIGNNRKIMIISLSSILLKFVVSYILIIILKMNIIGLGYSSMVATGAVSLVAIYEFFIKKDELTMRCSYFKPDLKLIWIIVLVAMPIIIEKSTQSFGNVIINGYATNLGENVLNAYGITNRVNSIIFSFSSGFGVAMVGIVSQNKAVGNYKRIKEAKKKGLLLSLGIVSLLLIIIFALSSTIARIYAGDDNLLYDMIKTAMSIYTVSALPWTIMHIYFGLFQGYQKTHYALIVSLCRLWIFRVFLVGLLLKFTNMGAYAIWFGMLISNILAMLVCFVIYIIDKNFRKLGRDECNEEII